MDGSTAVNPFRYFFHTGIYVPDVTKLALGSAFTLQKNYIYLSTSFRYFFDKGEVFIGLLLLFFTIIFPIIKYIFLFLTLSGRSFSRTRFVCTELDILSKWAMLDVFVVAVLILNMSLIQLSLYPVLRVAPLYLLYPWYC